MFDLFERIVEGGYEVLCHLVSEKLQEGVSVELKCKRDSSTGTFDRDDKRNLGKTLSAFSNSMGGLLIWGVECRKDEDGVDCASKLDPISDLDKFYSEANNLIGEYLSPRNENIRLHRVYDVSIEKAGYLAIYVERSERRPHRSNAANDGQYYKRVGGSSYPMEHYDIEDAFKRVVTPKLVLAYRLVGGVSLGFSRGIKVILSLKNEAAVSAMYPFLAIGEVRGAKIDQYGLDGNGSIGLPKRPSVGRTLFGGGGDAAVHPGQILDVTALTLQVKNGDVSPEPLRASELTGEIQDLSGIRVSFEYQVGCSNAPIVDAMAEVTEDEITKFLNRTSG